MHFLLKIQRIEPDPAVVFERGVSLGNVMVMAVFVILFVVGVGCVLGNLHRRAMPTWLLAIGVLTAPGISLLFGLVRLVGDAKPTATRAEAELVIYGILAMWVLYFGMLLTYKVLARRVRNAAGPETDWRGEALPQAAGRPRPHLPGGSGPPPPVAPQPVAAAPAAAATESAGAVARVKRPSREEKPKADADTPVFARCKSCMGRWKTTLGEAKALEACPKCGASPAPLRIQRA